MEGPPDDDCCPICHGPFNLPCRTSCSHWFCGECILRVWLYRDAMKQCKCPMCCHCFSSLTLFGTSFDGSQDPGALKTVENVRRYNRLHVGGLKGFFQKIFDIPFIIRMAIQNMMDPDKSSAYLFRARSFAILLGIIYVLVPLDFIPIDKQDALHLFDHGAMAFVIIMHVIGICRRRRSQRQSNRGNPQIT